MGNSEEGKNSKTNDKSSSPATEQGTVHVYPEWPGVQAYYGPRVALPPYFNSAVAPGHPPPPYVWGPPQAMMPPYGAPYAAIYSHGGVYGHPAAPYGSQPSGQGPPTASAKTEALGGTALSIDRPIKSSGNTDQGLVKKLKSFDGLAMAIGNGNSEKHEGVSENRSSLSGESAGSSNGSGGSTDETEETKRKRSREGSPVTAGNKNPETQPALPGDGKTSSAGEKVIRVPVTANEEGKMRIAPPPIATTLELRNPGVEANSTPLVVAPNAIIPSETWMQNERELKRERRKQSNRESARRSRLRKQAETEELARRVEALNAENMALKAEIKLLVENSGKLRQENSKLMEKLIKNTKPDQQPDETGLNRVGGGRKASPMNTENLLSRVNNSSMGMSSSGEGGENGDVYEKASNSGAKMLHQLLDTSRRADAVAAG